MAGPKPGQPEDVLRDRRGATRVPVGFPVSVRDATHVWKGEALNLSHSGVLLKIPNRLPVGKLLQLELKPEKVPPAALRGTVRQTSGLGLLGVQFDTKAVEAFEVAVNLFEGLLAMNPRLAVEVKRRPTALSKQMKLYSIPDSPVQPRPEEAKMLAYFVGGRSLGEVESQLGDRFGPMMYLPFSLLDRGLLSTVKPGAYGSE